MRRSVFDDIFIRSALSLKLVILTFKVTTQCLQIGRFGYLVRTQIIKPAGMVPERIMYEYHWEHRTFFCNICYI